MVIKNNIFKVLELFLDMPEMKVHIRNMAALTKLSPATVSTIVKKLKKEKLLISEKTNVFEYVSASRNEKFVRLKKCYNIYSIYESGLIEELRKRYEEPEAIVLFGSYSRGEDLLKSDIDIAVITKQHFDLDLLKFWNILRRKINIHEIQIKKAEKEFLNELVNGIVLYGYLKVLE